MPLAQASFWEERQQRLDKQKAQINSHLLASLPHSTLNGLKEKSFQFLNHLPELKPNLSHRTPNQHLAASKNITRATPLKQVIEAIPFSFGTIQEIFDPVSSSNISPVVLLQDIHLNHEAQSNLASLMQELIDDNKVSQIGLEGVFGTLDFKPYRRYHKKDMVHKVASTFMEDKLIGAPTFVGITSPRTPPLMIGVDDKVLHDKNVNAFIGSRKVKEEIYSVLVKINSNLDKIKNTRISPALRDTLQLVESYHRGKIGLGFYIKSLSKKRDEPSLIIEQFLSAYDMELNLDFEKANQERKLVIEKMAKTLDEKTLGTVLGKSLAYQMGRLSFGEFYGHLKFTCENYGILLSRTPAFDDYIRYVLLTDSLNVGDLFTAIADLEEKTLLRLAKSHTEKEVVQLAQHLLLTEKLLNFTLTPSEWATYQTHRKKISEMKIEVENLYHGKPAQIESFSSATSENVTIFRSLKNRGVFSKTISVLSLNKKELKEDPMSLASFEAFYEIAQARSHSMVKRLLMQKFSPSIRSEPPKALILVTGGFHTPDIAKELKAKSHPYVIVSPKLTKADESDGSSYLGIFAQEKTPLERLMAGEKLFITPTNQSPEFPPRALELEAALSLTAAPNLASGEINPNPIVINRNFQNTFLAAQEPFVTHLKPNPRILSRFRLFENNFAVIFRMPETSHIYFSQKLISHLNPIIQGVLDLLSIRIKNQGSIFRKENNHVDYPQTLTLPFPTASILGPFFSGKFFTTTIAPAWETYVFHHWGLNWAENFLGGYALDPTLVTLMSLILVGLVFAFAHTLVEFLIRSYKSGLNPAMSWLGSIMNFRDIGVRFSLSLVFSLPFLLPLSEPINEVITTQIHILYNSAVVSGAIPRWMKTANIFDASLSWNLDAVLINKFGLRTKDKPLVISVKQNPSIKHSYLISEVKSPIKQDILGLTYKAEEIATLNEEGCLLLLSRGVRDVVFTIPADTDFSKFFDRHLENWHRSSEGWDLVLDQSLASSLQLIQNFESAGQALANLSSFTSLFYHGRPFSSNGVLLGFLIEPSTRRELFSSLSDEAFQRFIKVLPTQISREKELHPKFNAIAIKIDIFTDLIKEILIRLSRDKNNKIYRQELKKLLNRLIYFLRLKKLEGTNTHKIFNSILELFSLSENLKMPYDSKLWGQATRPPWNFFRSKIEKWIPVENSPLSLNGLSFVELMGTHNWERLASHLVESVSRRLGGAKGFTHDYDQNMGPQLKSLWKTVESSDNPLIKEAFYKAILFFARDPNRLAGFLEFAIEGEDPAFFSRILALLSVTFEIYKFSIDNTRHPFPMGYFIKALRYKTAESPLNDLRFKRMLFHSVFSRLPISINLPFDSDILIMAKSPNGITKEYTTKKEMDVDEAIELMVSYFGDIKNAIDLIKARRAHLGGGDSSHLATVCNRIGSEKGITIKAQTHISKDATSLKEQDTLIKRLNEVVSSADEFGMGIRRRSRSDLEITSHNLDLDIYNLDRLIHRNLHRQIGESVIPLIEARFFAWWTGDISLGVELCSTIAPNQTKTWRDEMRRQNNRIPSWPLVNHFFNRAARLLGQNPEDIKVSLILDLSPEQLATVRSELSNEFPNLVMEIHLLFDREIELYRLVNRYFHPQGVELALSEIETTTWPTNVDPHPLIKSIRSNSPIHEQAAALVTLREQIHLLLSRNHSKSTEEATEEKPTYGEQHGMREVRFSPTDPIFKAFLLDLRLQEIENDILKKLKSTLRALNPNEVINTAPNILATMILLVRATGWGSLLMANYKEILLSPDITPDRLILVSRRIEDVINDYDRWMDRHVGQIIDAASKPANFSDLSMSLLDSLNVDNEDELNQQRLRLRTHIQRYLFRLNGPLFHLREAVQHVRALPPLPAYVPERTTRPTAFFPANLFPNQSPMLQNPAYYAEKGANLVRLGKKYGDLVPPGFIYPLGMTIDATFKEKLKKDLHTLEHTIRKFNRIKEVGSHLGFSSPNPILVSVRSAAIFDAPGQLPTVTNVGLSEENVEALGRRIGMWAAWDSLRRFYQEYAEAVHQMTPDQFQTVMDSWKSITGKLKKADFDVDEMKLLARAYLDQIKQITQLPDPIPESVEEQILNIILGINKTWKSERIWEYRKREGLSNEETPAIVIQTMVHGNSSDHVETSLSGAGVITAARWPWMDPEGSFARQISGADIADSVVTGRPIDQFIHPSLKTLSALTNEIASTERIRIGIEFTVHQGRPFVLQVRWVPEEIPQVSFVDVDFQQTPPIFETLALTGKAALGPLISLNTLSDCCKYLREHTHLSTNLLSGRKVFDPDSNQEFSPPDYLLRLLNALKTLHQFRAKYPQFKSQVGLIVAMKEGHPEQLSNLRYLDTIFPELSPIIIGWISEKGSPGSHQHENAIRLGVTAQAGAKNSDSLDFEQPGHVSFHFQGQTTRVIEGSIVSMYRQKDSMLVIKGPLQFEVSQNLQVIKPRSRKKQGGYTPTASILGPFFSGKFFTTTIAPAWETYVFHHWGLNWAENFLGGYALDPTLVTSMSLILVGLVFAFAHTLVEFLIRSYKSGLNPAMSWLGSIMNFRDIGVRFSLSLVFSLPFLLPLSDEMTGLIANQLHANYNLASLSGFLPTWAKTANIADPNNEEDRLSQEFIEEYSRVPTNELLFPNPWVRAFVNASLTRYKTLIDETKKMLRAKKTKARQLRRQQENLEKQALEKLPLSTAASTPIGPKLLANKLAALLQSNSPREETANALIELVTTHSLSVGNTKSRSVIHKKSWDQISEELKQEIKNLVLRKGINNNELNAALADLLFVLQHALTNEEMRGFILGLETLFSEITQEENPQDIFIWLPPSMDMALNEANNLVSPLVSGESFLKPGQRIIFILSEVHHDLEKALQTKYGTFFAHQQMDTKIGKEYDHVLDIIRRVNRPNSNQLDKIDFSFSRRFLITPGAQIPPQFFNIDSMNLSIENLENLKRSFVVYVVLTTLKSAIRLDKAMLPQWENFRQTLISA